MNRALSFFRGLERLHVQATVVFMMPDTNKSKVKEDYRYVKVKYLWDKLYFPWTFFKYVSYYIYCYQFLKQLKPRDIVYIGGLEKIAEKILKKDGVKLYLESTECPDVYGYLNPIHNTYPGQFIDICKRADGLFVISTGLRDYYTERGVEAKRIEIINMTVDRERFTNIKKAGNSDKFIAYCGTVSNNKDGVDKLIKAFSIVSKKHPEITLYIIGSIPSKQEECGNLLLIRSLGIEDKVRLTGLVPAEQMPQLLKNASLLALARPDNKQAKHGFPTKLGEYLMTENPVVVTAVGDIPLFLEDGISALIAPADDDDAFAQKMIWAIEHPEESSEIGTKGREVAEKYFNATIETKKMIDFISISNPE